MINVELLRCQTGAMMALWLVDKTRRQGKLWEIPAKSKESGKPGPEPIERCYRKGINGSGLHK
jgi:hypothetical protein